MVEIINISETVMLGIRAMLHLSSNPKNFISIHEIARNLNCSEGILAKILNKLVKRQLLESNKDNKGRFMLKRESNSIMLSEIYEIFEGSIQLNKCIIKPLPNDNDNSLDKLISSLNEQFIEYFQSTSIENLQAEVSDKI